MRKDIKHDLAATRDTIGLQDKHVIAIIESMTDGFIVLNNEWRYIYLNHQAEHIMKKKREDILGKIYWDLYPEAVGTIFDKKLHEAMGQQITTECEDFYKPSQKWYRFRASPSPHGLSIYFQDITQQKQAENELLYEACLIQSISDAVIATDMNDSIICWNEAAEACYGWKKGEILGKDIKTLRPSISPSHPREKWEQQLHTTGYWKGETLQQRRDGTSFPALVSLSAVKDHMGNRIGAVAVSRDITKRKHAETMLKESEARFKRVVDSNIIGIIFWDLQGNITDANDAFLDLIGYTREELLEGKIKWTEITPKEFEEQDYQTIEELKRHGRLAHAAEKAYIHKDGRHIPILIRGVFLDESQRHGVSFVMDITERKMLEQRKDDFIGMASHELKTPLTTLKALTQLLKRRAEKQQLHDFWQPLSQMERRIDMLTKLITELLDVSKIQSGQLDYTEKTIDVNEFLAEIKHMFQQTCMTHTINLHETSPKSINGDREHLEQVFINLLNNAVKYSPNAEKVDVTVSSDEKNVNIHVRDYGIGIPEKHQSKIFERFYRVDAPLKKTFPGLGMGLYIASKIVKRHGGTITVESEEGKGSTFTVSLPLLPEKMSEEEQN